MYILGITCFGQHDSGCALVRDGEVVFAQEEEKFSRIRHDNDFPWKGIEYCLRSEKIDINSVDAVAFYSDLASIPLETLKYMIRYFPKSLSFLSKAQNYFHHKSIEKILRGDLGFKKSIHYIKHHVCHAASTFYSSPFHESAILTIDGTGEWITTWMGTGAGGKITFLKEIKFPDSLGRLYETVTQFLGFEPNHGEGKVMGLASYGRDTYKNEFAEILRHHPDGTFRLDLSYFLFPYGREPRYSKKFIKLFGSPRLPGSEIKERDKDIAFSLQKRIEETALHIARYLRQATGLENLSIAGGVGLNSQMNYKIKKESGFREIFIFPACNDPGTAVGAAKYLYHHLLEFPHQEAGFWSPFTGAAFSRDEIIRAFDGKKVVFKESSDPSKLCAQLLAQDKIVGWFQGKLEFGPRALGNRSILASPRHAAMKDKINFKVKHRESFRPFAPAVLMKRCGEYFECPDPSPYMLLVYPVKKEKWQDIPAVIHVDGTGRIQTVEEFQNPEYYRVIKEFENLTGIPVILNTSLNTKGQPIVCTPEQAIDCFLETEMDVLFIGDFLAEK